MRHYYVNTNRFGKCLVRLFTWHGMKWYEVFRPNTDEVGNDYIGDVNFYETLDEVASAIDRELR